ncbi:MAG: FHA domain-containing protein [Kofleriaceae bacterium]
MDATEHYKNLVSLGREEFLASAAPAVLVRFRPGSAAIEGAQTLTLDQDGETIEETMPLGMDLVYGDSPEVEVYPLAKKAGASFPDRITIGRTPNNDIVITDASISRLHAYVKSDGRNWVVADAGSKNGSWLDRVTLEARKERKLGTRMVLRLGDVDLTFYMAEDLFIVLGGA